MTGEESNKRNNTTSKASDEVNGHERTRGESAHV